MVRYRSRNRDRDWDCGCDMVCCNYFTHLFSVVSLLPEMDMDLPQVQPDDASLGPLPDSTPQTSNFETSGGLVYLSQAHARGDEHKRPNYIRPVRTR